MKTLSREGDAHNYVRWSDDCIELSGLVTQLDRWGCRFGSRSRPTMKHCASEGPDRGGSFNEEGYNPRRV